MVTFLDGDSIVVDETIADVSSALERASERTGVTAGLSVGAEHFEVMPHAVKYLRTVG